MEGGRASAVVEAGRRGFCRVSALFACLWPIRAGRQDAGTECGIPGASSSRCRLTYLRNGRELITQAFGPSSISTISNWHCVTDLLLLLSIPLPPPPLFPALFSCSVASLECSKETLS